MRKISKILCISLCALRLFSSEMFAAEVSTVAKSAVLLCAETGDILYEKNSREHLPMASTTKIMTALVALEKCSLGKDVTVPSSACGIEGSSVYLHEGEHLTMEELLYALLLSSANDAATAIAIEVGGSVNGFADMMNEKAQALGLTDTHFTNPHGLDDEGHFTTAYDLAKLAGYALQNADFRKIVSTYRYEIGDGDTTRHLMNHNRLLKLYEDAIGVKTGFTKSSGRCLVSAAERDGVTLVAVTLCDPDDWNDHEAMLDFGFSEVESVSLCKIGEISVEIPCAIGEAESITASNREDVSVIMRKCHGDIELKIEVPHYIFKSVSKGDEIGIVRFCCDGKEIGTVSVFADCDNVIIKEKGFFERLFDLYR